MILSGGTAYQSDAGMCGDYDSVIGMDKTVPVARFVKKVKGERLSVAGGEGTLCAVFVETDDSTGFTRRGSPVRLGGDRKCPRLVSGHLCAARRTSPACQTQSRDYDIISISV